MPDTEPRPASPVLLSVSVAVPENDVPVCVSCHDTCPGPDESDAGPLQLPVRLTGPEEAGDGGG